MVDEVRVTSETGGQKGRKQAQLGAIDPAALLELAKVAGYGTHKYDRYNFLKGYDWSLSFDAMMRHALAFWNGEDNDPESGLPHMAHVGWHAMAMVAFGQRKVGTDDRPRTCRMDLAFCDELPECGDGVHADECAVSGETGKPMSYAEFNRALLAESLKQQVAAIGEMATRP